MFIGILHGVRALHLAQIVHYDLKPENVLVDKHGKVEIADIAGDGHYTSAYMAPEQNRTKKDWTSKCDVWAVGVILHCICTRSCRLPSYRSYCEADPSEFQIDQTKFEPCGAKF